MTKCLVHDEVAAATSSANSTACRSSGESTNVLLLSSSRCGFDMSAWLKQGIPQMLHCSTNNSTVSCFGHRLPSSLASCIDVALFRVDASCSFFPLDLPPPFSTHPSLRTLQQTDLPSINPLHCIHTLPTTSSMLPLISTDQNFLVCRIVHVMFLLW